jgi:predicted DNA binding CopG/RHH family protein
MENPIETNEINYDEVGTDENHATSATEAQEKAIDESLGLQPISIRLQKDLLDNLKALALLNGLGYQPLIRQVLTRWVDCELRSMLNDKVAKAKATTTEQRQHKNSLTDSDITYKANQRLAA